MNNSIAEVKELTQMRENIRHCVDALEQCWSCDRICECVPEIIGVGPVWLCGECQRQIRAFRADQETFRQGIKG